MSSLGIEKINQELKNARTGVTIVVRGSKISLLATLPPKPGSEKTKSYQQRISLGIYGNPAGIKRARLEAIKLGNQLALKEFRWEDWIELDKPVEKPKTIGDLLDRFEQDYFTRRKRTEKSETTFRTDYRSIFNKFDKNARIDANAFFDVVRSTEPDSKNRRRAVTTIGAIAKFAGLAIDLSPYRGKYETSAIDPRVLPSDEQIVRWYESIDDREVKFAFGLMACYGLRNHEVFHADLGSLANGRKILTVLDGKTGGRQVWCFPPDWFDLFECDRIDRFPAYVGKNNEYYGKWVTRNLKKYGILKPYDLRHAWARRAFENQLPDVLAAKQMGHSLAVHTRKYQTWIDAKQHQTAYDRIFS